MVPKVVSRGRSFKGAARYFLHDKEADTSDRVAWVETRNLQTDNPDNAWRIMAATAMDQKRLKQQAGIKATGRKSTQSVQHVLLSWHAEESDDLTKDQMHAAAEAAIARIGASDHQAMIIAHDDTEQKHVHILINRVSPIDGRLLSSSKEKLKLSEWAEQYERDRGKIYCEERVINNAARRRGEYTRGVKSKARHMYELEQNAPSNDNQYEKVRAEQRKKDALLSAQGRELDKQHKAAWSKLDETHKQRMASIRSNMKSAIGRAKDRVREGFRSKWSEHYHEQQAARSEFDKREKSMTGRIRNRFASVDLGKIISGEGTGRAIGGIFSAFTTKSGREAAFKRRVKAMEDELKRQQSTAEQSATAPLREQEKQDLDRSRETYLAERADVVLAQRMDKAKLASQWKKRNQERKAAHGRYYTPGQTKAARADQITAPHTLPAATEQDNTHSIKPSDLLPKKDADKRAKQVDQYKDLAAKRAKRKRQRKRDRGDQDRGR